MTPEQTLIALKAKELLNLVPLLTNMENSNETDMEVLTNTAFVCRKVADILDQMKKKVEAVGAKAEHDACLFLAASGRPRWRTEFCTVSPNPDFYVKFPTKPEEPGYWEFFDQLPKVALRPHFPTVEKLVNESIEKEQKIPFGLKDIKGVTLKLRMTTKKDL